MRDHAADRDAIADDTRAYPDIDSGRDPEPDVDALAHNGPDTGELEGERVTGTTAPVLSMAMQLIDPVVAVLVCAEADVLMTAPHTTIPTGPAPHGPRSK